MKLKKIAGLCLALCFLMTGCTAARPMPLEQPETPTSQEQAPETAITKPSAQTPPSQTSPKEAPSPEKEPEGKQPMALAEKPLVSSEMNPQASELPKDTSESEKLPPREEQQAEITLSITSPEGAVLEAYGVPFTENCTVADILKLACAENDLPVSWSGTKTLAYVKALAGYKEFQDGGLSGWLYEVNGTRPSKGCGAYRLTAGDTVLWRYTTDGK